MGKKSLAERVWNVYYGNDTLVARDAFGDRIAKADYDNSDSSYGWFIDHIRPKNEDGAEKLSNLRPLRIRSRFARGRYRST